jgi:hypothetical protein
MKTRVLFFLLLSLAGASACDLCGCYLPQSGAMGAQPAVRWSKGLYGAAGEQFTHFGTVQVDGREVDNPTGQREESSISQVIAGYGFTQRLALQMNVPVIHREFKRPEGFETDRGSVDGVGDVSLLARVLLLRTTSAGDALAASVVLFGGVKFPTGDSSRLKEEFHEVEVEGAPESGIHGHDLALGTGSYDGIAGGQASLRFRRFFFETTAQFTLRGDGRHSYHFANDLSWSGGPGLYLTGASNGNNLGVQCEVSGEYKDVDRFQGRIAVDTGITSVFVGPRVVGSRGRVSGEIAIGFPILLENTALQLVPDYRLHAGMSVSF